MLASTLQNLVLITTFTFEKLGENYMTLKRYFVALEGRRTIAASSFFPERSRQAPNRSYSLEKAKEYLKKSTYNGETIHIYFFAFKDSANDAHFLKERCEQFRNTRRTSPISRFRLYGSFY